jgi:hypothetical protein
MTEYYKKGIRPPLFACISQRPIASSSLQQLKGPDDEEYHE